MPSGSPMISSTDATTSIMLACESWTPFGGPVVPEV